MNYLNFNLTLACCDVGAVLKGVLDSHAHCTLALSDGQLFGTTHTQINNYLVKFLFFM